MLLLSIGLTDKGIFEIIHQWALTHPVLTVGGFSLLTILAWKNKPGYVPSKIAVTVFLLVALFWVFVAPRLTIDKASEPPISPPLSRLIERSTPRTFTSESGRFSVSVPGGTMEQEEPKPGVYAFSKQVLNYQYTVMYTDIPEPVFWQDRAMGVDPLDEVVKQWNEKNNKLQPQVKDISLGSFAGKEYNATFCPPEAYCLDKTLEHTTRGRAYLVGTRLYEVRIEQTSFFDQQEAARFLDSFKVVVNEQHR